MRVRSFSSLWRRRGPEGGKEDGMEGEEYGEREDGIEGEKYGEKEDGMEGEK